MLIISSCSFEDQENIQSMEKNLLIDNPIILFDEEKGQTLKWTSNTKKYKDRNGNVFIDGVEDDGRRIVGLPEYNPAFFYNNEVKNEYNGEEFYLSFNYSLYPGFSVGSETHAEIVIEFHEQGVDNSYTDNTSVATTEIRLLRYENSFQVKIHTANGEYYPFTKSVVGETAGSLNNDFIEIYKNDIKINGVSILLDPNFIPQAGYEANVLYLGVSKFDVKIFPGASISNINLKGYGEKQNDFSGSCSCSDDTQIDKVNYNYTSYSDIFTYEVFWSEIPSGYSTVQLGYTTNNGREIVVSEDFQGCENGSGWFTAPKINLSNGPKYFWLRAGNAGTFRICNGVISPKLGTIDFGSRLLK